MNILKNNQKAPQINEERMNCLVDSVGKTAHQLEKHKPVYHVISHTMVDSERIKGLNESGNTTELIEAHSPLSTNVKSKKL